MQKWKSYTLNISVVILLLLTIFFPFFSINKYYDLILGMNMDLSFFSNIHLLIYVGLFVVNSISIVINYNILKVICKLINFKIKNRDTLIIYLIPSLILTILNHFIGATVLNIDWLIFKAVLTTILYILIVIVYCVKNIYEIKKGLKVVLIFNLINMLIELYSLYGISK